MRLRSDFFVDALLRRAQSEGAYASLSKRGQEQAGSIFVVVDFLNGNFCLFTQIQGMDSNIDCDRFFYRAHSESKITKDTLDKLLAKEIKFDPDCWVVEIEDKKGRSFIEMAS